MKLTYSNSLDDFIAFNNWYAESIPNFKAGIECSRTLISLSIVGFCLLLANFRFEQPTQRQDVYALVFGGIVAAIYFYIKYPATIKRRRELCVREIYKDGKGEGAIFGKHTLEIVGSSLHEKAEFNESKHEIEKLHKIAEIPDYIFIMVGPAAALIVSRKKVEEGNLDAFVLELKKQMPKTDDLSQQTESQRTKVYLYFRIVPIVALIVSFAAGYFHLGDRIVGWTCKHFHMGCYVRPAGVPGKD